MEYEEKLANEAEGTAASSPQDGGANAVSLSVIFQIALRYWYWIAVSVIICVGLAFLIVKKTVPMYTRTCEIVIRDDAQSSVGSAAVDLSDIGVGMTNTVLEDEMASLQSPDLMEIVVTKLGLQLNYTSPGTFHSNVLYGKDVPLTVSFPDMAQDQSATLRVRYNEEGVLTVEDMVINIPEQEPIELPDERKVNFGVPFSTPVGKVVINKTPFFKSDKEYTVDVTRYSLRGAADLYCKEMTIDQQNKKSNVVVLTIDDASIERGDDILSELVNSYNQTWINSKAEVVAATSKFITERLNVLENELSNVDSDISSYKSDNLIPDLAQASTIYMQQSNIVSNQILELNNQLQMARYLKNHITSEGANNEMLPVNIGVGSPSIEAQISEYNRMLMQRNSHLKNTNASNPLIMDYDASLASMRNSIATSLDNQIVALNSSIRSLERSESNANARVAANPRQAEYLLSAERQQKVKETLYLYLLQKREENELTQTFTSINTRILKRPSGPNKPSSPKKHQILLAGFLLGVLIPFGVIYAREALNTKLRGRKDIEGLNIPIIGEIPRIKHKNARPFAAYMHPSKMRDMLPADDDIIVEEGKRDVANEAFRVMRTNINFLSAGHLPAVFMITSFNAGSGKSFISINTAIALALRGKKVLVIDCDLRRGSVSRVVDSPRKGIANYLNGSVDDIDSLIVHDVCGKKTLSLLPSGAFPPNPTELLEDPRFKEAIAHLRTEYDYIIIDCPPMEMMADAQIVEESCDRVFCVLRIGVFERSMLENLERVYKSKKMKNLAIVLNDAETSSRYGSTYRYGYGYGYGGKGYGRYYSSDED